LQFWIHRHAMVKWLSKIICPCTVFTRYLCLCSGRYCSLKFAQKIQLHFSTPIFLSGYLKSTFKLATCIFGKMTIS